MWLEELNAELYHFEKMSLKNATFFAFLADFGRFLPNEALGTGFAYRMAAKVSNHASC